MQRDSRFHPPLTASSIFQSVKLPLRKGPSQEIRGTPTLLLTPFSGGKSPGLSNPSALIPLSAKWPSVTGPPRTGAGRVRECTSQSFKAASLPCPSTSSREVGEGETDLQLQPRQLSTFSAFLVKGKKEKRIKSPLLFCFLFLFSNLLFCPELVLLEIPCS